METLKFKTNINCGGCVAKVTPVLNGLKGIASWEVDTANPAKTLTVNADEGVTAQQINQAIKSIGFQSESI
ncbi:MAG: heavy-metal-associated domain-containing protein [Sphingobacteriaceae bacterium]|nr:MAG: heavy-metal-associated domain-containing protein [Sphingobacteriaceae bacterium]